MIEDNFGIKGSLNSIRMNLKIFHVDVYATILFFLPDELICMGLRRIRIFEV